MPRKRMIRAMAQGGGAFELVRVNISDTMKPMVVTVNLNSPDNTVQQIQTGLPLGAVMEENAQGDTVVMEVDEAGEGYSNGLRVGDILRATSCVVNQKPDMQAYYSGVGLNNIAVKALFEVPKNSFAQAMDEIRSNLDLEPISVLLVVERPAAADTAQS
eukprot:gnl/TRDRNA2_/TRDRNA2_70151_c1_seq1.p1 gnl/TRDRNA2_/TRDRNA2_70151_c1~~gnl/TRDRNA2_/TRDRNA2_70151_c1_seq1.p1  ORF type:complete len:159 (-),score=24.16 gnl/TRDRNA2_/TRDRNA2_70151_c1_seq1:58-534(-)